MQHNKNPAIKTGLLLRLPEAWGKQEWRGAPEGLEPE